MDKLSGSPGADNLSVFRAGMATVWGEDPKVGFCARGPSVIAPLPRATHSEGWVAFHARGDNPQSQVRSEWQFSLSWVWHRFTSKTCLYCFLRIAVQVQEKARRSALHHNYLIVSSLQRGNNWLRFFLRIDWLFFGTNPLPPGVDMARTEQWPTLDGPLWKHEKITHMTDLKFFLHSKIMTQKFTWLDSKKKQVKEKGNGKGRVRAKSTNPLWCSTKTPWMLGYSGSKRGRCYFPSIANFFS